MPRSPWLGPTLHGFRSTNGTYIDLPTGGVLAGSHLASQLDVSIGDTLMLATFSSDIFQLGLVLPWWVLPGSAVGVLLAAGISLWPASRAIKRVDVAKGARERSI
jgi:hypothetical protein